MTNPRQASKRVVDSRIELARTLQGSTRRFHSLKRRARKFSRKGQCGHSACIEPRRGSRSNSIRIVLYVGRKGPTYWVVWVVSDLHLRGKLGWMPHGSVTPRPTLRNAAFGGPRSQAGAPSFFSVG